MEFICFLFSRNMLLYFRICTFLHVYEGVLYIFWRKFESKLSNIELKSAEADKGYKFESKLSNIDLKSAEADKGYKYEKEFIRAPHC